MAWRFHGRARVNPRWPQAFGICDGCGFQYNLIDLNWQHEYAGTGLVNLRFLHCDVCLDDPQPQLKTRYFPRDPDPVLNARPPNRNFQYENTSFRSTVPEDDIRITVDDQPRVVAGEPFDIIGFPPEPTTPVSVPLPLVSVTLNYETGQYAVDGTSVAITDILGADPFGWGYNYNPSEIVAGGLRTSGFQDPTNTPAFLAPIMHAINANPTGFTVLTELTTDDPDVSGGYFWVDNSTGPTEFGDIAFWAGFQFGFFYVASNAETKEDSVHQSTGTREKIAVSYGPTGCHISVAGATTLNGAAGTWSTALTFATPSVTSSDNVLIHKQTFFLGIKTGTDLSSLAL